VQRVEVEDAGPYARQFLNLGAAIRGEGEPLLGRPDAMGQARALDALQRSADAGGAPVAPA
jgi:D-xylose 1-dehydrogenase (NADP+, D-xylono-1,5-lactone-forming)